MDQKQLLNWYKGNRRDLPWRISKDPYRIWISEIMLQQTTVTAVIPFYERFMAAFPTVQDLAKAPLEKVLTLWSGLGYYSRARSLHKAAQIFAQNGFSKSYIQLLEIPGLGPYTARAVSSIAFDEPVGIVDGNAIRVLARKYGIDEEWWTSKGRAKFQEAADELARGKEAGDVNQAVMDLGSMICTPKNPKHLLCPWVKSCKAYQKNCVDELPRMKPRRESEIWIWKPNVPRKGEKLGIIQNDYAPFLKGQWMWPGRVVRAKAPPKKFDFTHCVTHHKIYVVIEPPSSKTKDLRWIKPKELVELNPTSLIRKTMDLALRVSAK